MRWMLRIGIGLGLAWLVFLASPFVALHGLGRAVETRDVEAVRARVNFRALRLSLLKQVIGAYLDERAGRALGPAERQLAADAGATAADPLVAQLLTPEAIIELLNEGWPKDLRGTIAADEPARPGSAGGGARRRRQDDARRLAARRDAAVSAIRAARVPQSPGLAAAGRAERAAVPAPASARADDLEAHRHRASRRALEARDP